MKQKLRIVLRSNGRYYVQMHRLFFWKDEDYGRETLEDAKEFVRKIEEELKFGYQKIVWED